MKKTLSYITIMTLLICLKIDGSSSKGQTIYFFPLDSAGVPKSLILPVGAFPTSNPFAYGCDNEDLIPCSTAFTSYSYVNIDTYTRRYEAAGVEVSNTRSFKSSED